MPGASAGRCCSTVLEITQFTYFQQSGGIDLDPISVEITYGLERICAFLQDVESVYDIRWTNDKTYGSIRLAEEQQLSEYSFDRSDAKALRAEFELHEKEAKELLEGWKELVGAPTKELKGHAGAQRLAENVGAPTKARARYPFLAAYDHCLKCSHLFNLMDARGVISTTERAALMQRVRTLACRTAAAYLEQIGGKDNVGAPTVPGDKPARGALDEPRTAHCQLPASCASRSSDSTSPEHNGHSHRCRMVVPSSRRRLHREMSARRHSRTGTARAEVCRMSAVLRRELL